jgi:hypothetical protein
MFTVIIPAFLKKSFFPCAKRAIKKFRSIFEGSEYILSLVQEKPSQDSM